MAAYDSLKAIWKKLGINGHVLNFSSQPLWALETDTGSAIAHLLPPMTRSPPKVDADAFKRYDGKTIKGHKSWWKFYDVSNAEVFDSEKGDGVTVSVISMTAVPEGAFGEVRYDRSKNWAVPIQVIMDVKRHKKTKKITHYMVSGAGWLDPEIVLEMTCRHQIANARPVFPESGVPYIRTRRDPEYFNNIEAQG